MSDTTAWSALALSVTNSGVLVVRGWRSRRHRLAAGPSAAIRTALEAAREECQSVIALGGASSSWFLDDARRTTDQRLSDLAKRTDDPRLVKLLGTAAASWRTGFGHAPPPSPNVYSMDSIGSAEFNRAEAEDAARRDSVVEAIRAALSAVEGALDRVNELERRL